MGHINKQLSDFNEALSSYIDLYKAIPCNDSIKLKKLEEFQEKINQKIEQSLADVFDNLAGEADALLEEMQKNKKQIEIFIKKISTLKEHFNNTAQILDLIDKALVFAAGIASRC